MTYHVNLAPDAGVIVIVFWLGEFPPSGPVIRREARRLRHREPRTSSGTGFTMTQGVVEIIAVLRQDPDQLSDRLRPGD